MAICTVCGKDKKCTKNRKTGELICHTCNYIAYYHNIDNWETCKFCAKLRYVSVRTAEGEPVCPSCYRIKVAKHYKCERCNKERHLVYVKKLDAALCSTCRGRVRLKDTSAFEDCSLCGNSRPVATRDYYGASVCYHCYPKFKNSIKE